MTKEEIIKIAIDLWPEIPDDNIRILVKKYTEQTDIKYVWDKTERVK